MCSAINNHGIDLNAKTKYGNTAFYYACFHGHVNVVKILMENTAVFSINLKAKNSVGNTAFHMACKEGHLDVVKILMENSATLSIDLYKRQRRLHRFPLGMPNGSFKFGQESDEKCIYFEH